MKIFALRVKMYLCSPRRVLVLAYACVWIAASNSVSSAETQQSVQNSNKPIDGIRIAHLREIWRAGDDENGVYFGKVERIVAGANGATYILDRQRKVVQHIDNNGKWIRTYGRAGEGPGEFGSVCDLFFVPGEAIGVAQVIPGKVVMLDMHGDPLPTIYTPDFGGVNMLYRTIKTGRHLVMASRTMATNDEGELEARSMVYSVELDGELGVVYHETRSAGPMARAITLSEKALLGFTYFWDVGDHGQVYISDEWNDYRIKVLLENGELDTIISRDCEASKRSRNNLAQRQGRYSLDLAGRAVELEFEDTERCIKGLYARPSGELWVVAGCDDYTENDSSFVEFDVFNARGVYTSKVVVEADASLQYDYFQFAGEYMYVIYGQNNEILEFLPDEKSNPREEVIVACYRLEW